MSKLPHPDRNPHHSKAKYACVSVFATAQANIELFLSEGASLQEAARLAQQMQTIVGHAYHAAVKGAGIDVAGPIPEPLHFDEDEPGDSPDTENPFGDLEI